MSSIGRTFETVADLYDEVRPRYPDELYDLLAETVGGLANTDVLDLAAGTGIASRALSSRGAKVVALDPGEPMLRRLRTASPDLPAVVAGAEALPLGQQVVDLVTCATAWHWLATTPTLAEVQRVLRPGGHLALWWANNAWDDGIAWENAQSAVFERWDSVRGSVPPTFEGVGPHEAAEDLRGRGIDVVVDREFTWTREVTREQHMRMLATHSNNLVLPEAERGQLLAEIEDVLAPWPVVTERLWGPLVIARFL